MNTPSEALLRRRKSLLVMPLLVLPFLTLAFWALGGGQSGTPPTAAIPTGLSLALPEAQFKKGKEQDKLSLYEQTRRRPQKQITGQEEGLLPRLGLSVPAWEAAALPDTLAVAYAPSAHTLGAQEAQINQRLDQLSALTSGPLPRAEASGPADGDSGRPGRFSQDVDRLEAMMQRLDSPPSPNPEMQQMEALLERILDIQHPERVRSQPEESTAPALLQGRRKQSHITLLGDSRAPLSANYQAAESNGAPAPGFYSLPFQHPVPDTRSNAIQAVIPSTQTLTSGAHIKLRLLEDLQLEDRQLPRGSLLYGTCRLRGERLLIEVSSVLAGQQPLHVSLTAYDLDGQEGLFIPGAQVQEAAGRAIQQSLGLPVLSPSVGAQATSAGISVARDLLRRQARQVKVTVKSGHRVLLQNKQMPY